MTADTISPKYELTDETRTVSGRTLYRIRALQAIPRRDVEAGDLGGFIESEANLSHEGGCWVGGEACAYEDARVVEGAYVGDAARIFGSARAGGRSVIAGCAYVSGNAHISEGARVDEKACVSENASIRGTAKIRGFICVSGNAHISDRVFIPVNIPMTISGDACITDERHVFYMGPLGRERQYLFACRTKGDGACIYKISHYPEGGGLYIKPIHSEFGYDEYRSLFEMARNPAEHDRGDNNEPLFMIQMMLARSVEWDDCNPAGENKPRKKKGEKKPAATSPKYELTDESITEDDCTLYRIRALRDIPRYGVRAGDTGGFVESEKNLSHKNDCWIGGRACVYEKARVKGNALVTEQACICGHARVYETAEVAGSAHACDKARIHGEARISIGYLIGDADISNDRHVFLVGPVGSTGCDWWFFAYRSRRYKVFIGGSSFSPALKPWDMENFYHIDRHENCGFLSEMARTQPENWPDIEYGFMMQMMKTRIEEWKRDA